MGNAGVGLIDQTHGREARVLGEDTLIPDDLAGEVQVSAEELTLRVCTTVLHSGDQGTHLEGGAGGVVGAEGAVEERLQGVGLNLGPVLIHGGEVIGGIAGAGQNLAGLDLHDDDRRALRVQAVTLILGGVLLRVGQLLHDVGKRVLGNALKLQVNGGLHVVSGDGGVDLAGFLIHAPELLDDGAVLGNHVHALAVDAVEVFLKSFLKAGLADVGVHGVAFLLVLLPVGGVHAAHVA